MTVHSRYIHNALAYYEGHRDRLCDAIGPGVIKYLDHFISVPRDDTTRNPLGWLWFSDTATDSCTLLDGVTGGVLALTTGGADNNATGLQLGSIAETHQAPFYIAGAAGAANGHPLYFGIKVKVKEHADEGVFVGLAEPNQAVDNFLADNTMVPADKDFIGFRVKSDDSDAWDVAWRLSGQAEQEIAAAAVNAADWHTFEFFYDGGTSVEFFIDGTKNATKATTTAATFPAAEKLSPILYVKDGAGAAKEIQVDWLRVILFE